MSEDEAQAIPSEVGGGREVSIGTRDWVQINRQLAVLSAKSKEHDESLKRGAQHFSNLDQSVTALSKELQKQALESKQEWETKLDSQTRDLRSDLSSQTTELKKDMKSLQPKRLGWVTIITLGLAVLAGPVTAIIIVAYNAGSYPKRDELNAEFHELRVLIDRDHDEIMQIHGALRSR
jgi:hypothetical protein